MTREAHRAEASEHVGDEMAERFGIARPKERGDQTVAGSALPTTPTAPFPCLPGAAFRP